MTDSPYFFTWTAQKNAVKIPLEKATSFHFISTGQKIVDMSSLSYQASFGLHNQKIIKAMTKQMDSFSLASPKNTFRLKEKVADRLGRLASKSQTREYRSFFTQSGSESIENALKMARQITGKKYILCQQNSYHGSTLGALSATGDWRNKPHLNLSRYTIRIPSPTEDPEAVAIEKIILKHQKKGIAAFCLETITGGNGVFAPTGKWFSKIQNLCNKYQILLILDEVVCGAHRTGPFFGFQNYKNLRPDFICLAKALTGGYFPLGAVLVKEKLAKYYDTNILACGLTNYAHPIGLAATWAVLQICDQKTFINRLNENIAELASFKSKIGQLPNLVTTRQSGMLMAIEVNSPITSKELLDNGIFVAVQKDRIILAPALTMPKRVLQTGLQKIYKFIQEKS